MSTPSRDWQPRSFDDPVPPAQESTVIVTDSPKPRGIGTPARIILTLIVIVAVLIFMWTAGRAIMGWFTNTGFGLTVVRDNNTFRDWLTTTVGVIMLGFIFGWILVVIINLFVRWRDRSR